MSVTFIGLLGRNLICLFPAGRDILFPSEKLSQRFGPADADYSWKIFFSCLHKLGCAGFKSATFVLEVGPGRNLGTSLLWWCYLRGQTTEHVQINCWNVFPNAKPDIHGFWPDLAASLLAVSGLPDSGLYSDDLTSLREVLAQVSTGATQPLITYQVATINQVARQPRRYDLVYSQACIEHVWLIDAFCTKLAGLTVAGGWHGHRIDLADHGRRATNYIEMLQWPDWAYWLTMRFVPGAINRWRAADHLAKLQGLGFEILFQAGEVNCPLPIPRSWLARQFCNLSGTELRTTALDLVARKLPAPQLSSAALQAALAL
jgi:hypothetical protein